MCVCLKISHYNKYTFHYTMNTRKTQRLPISQNSSPTELMDPTSSTELSTPCFLSRMIGLSLENIVNLATEFDPIFITKLITKDNLQFNIVRHENPAERFFVYRIINDLAETANKSDSIIPPDTTPDRNNNDADGNDTDTSEESITHDNNDTQPTIFECTLYGRITHLEVGPYGNWYPSKLQVPANRTEIPKNTTPHHTGICFHRIQMPRCYTEESYRRLARWPSRIRCLRHAIPSTKLRKYYDSPTL